MLVFTVSNNKGGVGKTTTADNVAKALALRGAVVLQIDLDPQGNLTQSHALPLIPTGQAPRLTMAQVLSAQVPLAQAVVPVGEGLYLAPGSPELLQTEKLLAAEPGGVLALRELLAGVQGVDYVIIDTPPGMGVLTQSALTAADVVLIPVQPEYYGLEGLAALVNTCHQIKRRLNPGLRIGGIFFTRYNRNDNRRVLKDLVSLLEGHEVLGPLVMQWTVRENVAVKQAQARRQNLLLEYPTSFGAVDYIRLTSEILLRL